MTERTAQPDGVRLSKWVAEHTGCSRSQAEQLITDGLVRVDGQVVEHPQFRVQGQHVEVPAQALHTLGTRPAPVTFLLHKPPGLALPLPGQVLTALPDCLAASRQAADDRSGLQALQRHGRGLVLLTPLEPAASGLCVFSQDGRLQRKWREDADRLEHEFLAEVAGPVSPDVLQRLNRMARSHPQALPPRVSLSRQDAHRTGLRFALKDHQPGEIAQGLLRAGLDLMALKRLRIGRLPLAGLMEGQWRFALPYERF